MIDSDFIIKYTNALYSTSAEYSPTYDEFRDMFSMGQIKSKEWFMENLKNIRACLDNNKILIVGAWFGTLGLLIKKQYPSSNITLLDIDPRCKHYVQNVIYDINGIDFIIEDMFSHAYTEDIIINTSCEHIKDYNHWLSLIPKGKIVILQSNDFIQGKDHVNCVNSIEEFVEKTNIKEIWYSGKLTMPMYTRYMIIGYT